MQGPAPPRRTIHGILVKISFFANKLLSVAGLKVTRIGPSQKRFPVELSDADKSIFSYVRENRLSTSSDERLFATILACRHAVEANIEGDFVECGVWRGGNSIVAADVFKNLRSSRDVWLYDTFAGMTDPTSVDVDYRGKSADSKYQTTRREDHNEWCYSPLDEVKGYFAKAGLLQERVKFVVGDVAQTLFQSGSLPARISVLRLDTDWYASTKIELEVLYPRLSPGGIIILDDYGHWGGARKAVDEFFATTARPFLHYIDQAARIGVKRS